MMSNVDITMSCLPPQCHKPPMTGNGLYIPTITIELVMTGGWFIPCYTVYTHMSRPQIIHPQTNPVG